MQERKAVKFFIDKQGFMTEQHLFSLEPLRPFAPAFIANSDGAVHNSHGYVFPPHTFAEAGQPLETWMGGNCADVITCVQVCCYCCSAVAVTPNPGNPGLDTNYTRVFAAYKAAALHPCHSRKQVEVESGLLICIFTLLR
jgi:hypothetical protein